MAEKILCNFIESSIFGAVIISIVLFFSLFIKKRAIFKVRYWIWLILAIRMIAPLKIELPGNEIKLSVNMPHEAFDSVSIPYIPVNTLSDYLTEYNISSNRASYLQTILLVWLAGFMLYTIYHALSYMLMKKDIEKWSEEISDSNIIFIFEDISKKMKIKNIHKILICKKISSPMIVGFIKTKILLPEHSYSDGELKMIFEHELTHCKRFDQLYRMLMIFVNALHWFNPFVYMMVNFSAADVELYCDNDVIRNKEIEYKKNYSNLILAHITVKKKLSAIGPTSMFYGEAKVKERVDCLFNSTEKRKATIISIFIFLSIVLSSFVYVKYDGNVKNNFGQNNKFSLQVFPPDNMLDLVRNNKYLKPVDSEKAVVINDNYIIFSAEKGSQVNAIYGGKIISTGYHYSFGNYIKISGEDGIDIIYSGLEDISVSENQAISKGQVIGKSGDSGNAYYESCGLRAYKGEERVSITQDIPFDKSDKIIHMDYLSFVNSDKETLFN